jgi:hypothetical protein
MLVGGGRGLWTTLGGLLPPSPDILRAFALLRLLVGLFLPSVLLLPSSIDIASQYDVVLLHLLKFFLDKSQFIF